MIKLSKKKNNKGFTLVELIVVIAILAILVGLLAPQYTKYVEKSRKSADVSNLENLVTGLKVAASDQEYRGISGSTDITYTITITKDKTTLTVTPNTATANLTTAEQALDAYAGTKFSEATTGEDGSLKLKSKKWGWNKTDKKGNGAEGTIFAKVTINAATDAVTVEYCPAVEKYSKDGTLN